MAFISYRAEGVSATSEAPGFSFSFWGRLDNRRDLIAQLGPETASDSLSDTELALAGWRRWGEALPERLIGDFALAAVDPVRHRVFLARDPMGVKPLYYARQGEDLVFAHSVAALKAMPGLTLTPDLDWAARYLLHLSASVEQTGYREVFKLPPGHSLSFVAGKMTLRRWHSWRDDAPDALQRDPRWVEAYRAALEEAIRCRMVSDSPMGTENSGGIDSAAITAYLAHFLGEPGDRLHSFGLALCEQEPAFILETSRASRIRHNYVVTALDEYGDEALERGLQALGYPEEHGNATGHIPFYRECALRGIRTLFSGFGGDEVVTNPGHQLRWELLDAQRYGQLWDILPGDPVRRGLRLAKAIALRRRQHEYRPGFLRAWLTRWPHQPLREEVVSRLDLYDQYMETARYDAPYRRINDFILQHHLKRMQVTTRLENCTLLAASYGIDYRWPLWDVRLVQQYLSTPSIEKVGPKGIGRYLHRRAIDHLVPKRVAWKPSKDMGYARLQQEMNIEGIIGMAEQARRQEAYLHPALEALVDREKFRQQIARAAQGGADESFAFTFRRSVRAIRWLNYWLYDGQMPG